ncbi:unnamed protein product [Wuchereria bancrofti]|uniref:Uncharacterized protein n=1 Tax=Wuchereria bancrofti TaxID=6293 RepID=A0A3P7FMT0_WUCBA|nr:unnamed protein product [Wuchereria bancrofti]
MEIEQKKALLNCNYYLFVKDNSEQNKLLPQQSKKLDVRKQPFGPAPLPKGAISKGTITALGASNKQALQQIPITANQIKNDKDIQPTQLSKEQTENAKNGRKNLLQRIKDIKEKKDGQVQYEQYKSVKRRKKVAKKGKKLEIVQTQRSTQMKEQLKEEDQMKNEEQEEEEEENDDTMKGIASLQQDLNIVSAEE